MTPIILRTDPQGFFFYWTDQNKVREKVSAPEWFFPFLWCDGQESGGLAQQISILSAYLPLLSW